MLKLSSNFEKILSLVHGNFEELYKVLEYSIIIINYCIVIINAYYNYIMNACHNYCVANKGLVEEYDGEENVAVSVAANASCLQRKSLNIFFNVKYSPSHHQAGSALLAELFGSIGNSCTVSTQSRMWPYAHSSQHTDSSLGKEMKKETPVNVSCHGHFSTCHFVNASSALGLLFAAGTRLLDYKCAHFGATNPVLWLKARAV